MEAQSPLTENRALERILGVIDWETARLRSEFGRGEISRDKFDKEISKLGSLITNAQTALKEGGLVDLWEEILAAWSDA